MHKLIEASDAEIIEILAIIKQFASEFCRQSFFGVLPVPALAETVFCVRRAPICGFPKGPVHSEGYGS